MFLIKHFIHFETLKCVILRLSSDTNIYVYEMYLHFYFVKQQFKVFEGFKKIKLMMHKESSVSTTKRVYFYFVNKLLSYKCKLSQQCKYKNQAIKSRKSLNEKSYTIKAHPEVKNRFCSLICFKTKKKR